MPRNFDELRRAAAEVACQTQLHVQSGKSYLPERMLKMSREEFASLIVADADGSVSGVGRMNVSRWVEFCGIPVWVE